MGRTKTNETNHCIPLTTTHTNEMGPPIKFSDLVELSADVRRAFGRRKQSVAQSESSESDASIDDMMVGRVKEFLKEMKSFPRSFKEYLYIRHAIRSENPMPVPDKHKEREHNFYKKLFKLASKHEEYVRCGGTAIRTSSVLELAFLRRERCLQKRVRKVRFELGGISGLKPL